MDTNLLIDRLSTDCAPVRCLRCPATRSATWLAIAVPYVILASLIYPGANLSALALDGRLIVEEAAALLTAITAVFTAFAVTVPGYDRRILLLPVLPLLVWLGSLVAGSTDEWLRDGFAGLWLRGEWVCVRWMLSVGAIPAIVLAVMLRKGAPMSPYKTAALGGLAAATLAHFSMRLFHPEEVSVLMAVWHSATVIAVSALAGWAGRYWISWRATTASLRRKLATG
jgi:hypothetical protein